MKVLVTGGAGFIGTYVTRRFLERGDDVTILDNFETSTRNSVPAGVEIICGDIRDDDVLRTATNGVDVVVHLAALVSVEQSFAEASKYRDVNIDGTRRVLIAARCSGVKKVVLASSAAVYGDDPTLPRSEDIVPRPTSPYAFTKWVNEIDAEYESRYLGLETISLRFFNVYGPGQRLDSSYSGVITVAVSKLITGGVFTINGDGNQTRDFIFVRDLAEAIVASAVQETSCRVLNVGSGCQISLLHLISQLEAVTGKKMKIKHGPSRAGDVRHSIAGISRMVDCLRFTPRSSLSDGLVETVAWIEAHSTT